ncbi:MAG: hypothetical protein ACI8PP_000670 [Candidatus Pseudothioglobus sp.]
MDHTARRVTIALSVLLKTRPVIKTLRLRSLAPNLYLVEVQLQSEFLTVTDDHGKNLAYTSPLEAKRPFKSLAVDTAVLIHTSSYDEMIGQTIGQGNQLETRISLPVDDYS